MLSVPDLAILGAVALILFGPDQLPKVARKAGNVMRDVQNTSHAFLREMERAADEHDVADERKAAAETTTPYDTARYDYPYGATEEHAAAEPAPAEPATPAEHDAAAARVDTHDAAPHGEHVPPV